MNTQTQEALKMAIEGLEQLLLFLYQEEETALYCNKFYEIQTAKKNIEDCNKKINACKEALEAEQVRQAQEPVAFSNADEIQELKDGMSPCYMYKERLNADCIPLYTHPHQWQGLTDDEIASIPCTNRQANSVER
jgi:hypothetical protein